MKTCFNVCKYFVLTYYKDIARLSETLTLRLTISFKTWSTHGQDGEFSCSELVWLPNRSLTGLRAFYLVPKSIINIAECVIDTGGSLLDFQMSFMLV